MYPLIFNRWGRSEPAGSPAIFAYDLTDRPHCRKVWRADIETAPASELIVVLSEERPLLHAAGLARCGMIIASGGAVDFYGRAQAEIDEIEYLMAGLSWWAVALGNRDTDMRLTALRQCSAVLTCCDIDRSNPGDVAALWAVAEIMTTLSVGGHA